MADGRISLDDFICIYLHVNVTNLKKIIMLVWIWKKFIPEDAILVHYNALKWPQFIIGSLDVVPYKLKSILFWKEENLPILTNY